MPPNSEDQSQLATTLPLKIILQIADMLLDDAVHTTYNDAAAYETAYAETAVDLGQVNRDIREHTLLRTYELQQASTEAWHRLQVHNMEMRCKHKSKHEIAPGYNLCKLCVNCTEDFMDSYAEFVVDVKLREVLRVMEGQVRPRE